MKKLQIHTSAITLLLAALLARVTPCQGLDRYEFKTQQIDGSLGVGYAVVAADINGDQKPDLVVADKTRVVWYRNPDWGRQVLLEGQTRPENVCLAAQDIDGDGDIDLALGADWKPFNTASGGTLQWLENPGNKTTAWEVHPIGEEPTLHRIRFLDLQGDGKPELVVVPLMGKGASQAKNWMDGVPLRVLALEIPPKPKTDRWAPVVLDQSLHVAHNFCPAPNEDDLTPKAQNILIGSYEGIHLLKPTRAKVRGELNFQKVLIHEGNQANPRGSRGVSEIRWGNLGPKRPCIGTIEPWHGNQVVIYTQNPEGVWNRKALDDRLKWGHAIHWADLDGDGRDELVAGIRDNLGEKPGEQCGIRIYHAQDSSGEKWDRQLVDSGGVAVEDALVTDLDGNGKADIVAVGRATGNVRIYWQGK
jgi:hypothetical protein